MSVSELMRTGMFPQFKRIEHAALAWEAGRAIGLTPFESLKNIVVIGGNLAFTSALFAMLIKRAGYKYIAHSTATEAKCTIFEHWDSKGWVEIGCFEFSVEDAKKAGLWGRGQWAKYPKAMLWARAVSGAARALCPDAIMGRAYTHEEMGAEAPVDDLDSVAATDDDGTVIEGEVDTVMPQPEFMATLDIIAGCDDIEALQLIGKSISQSEASRDQLSALRKAYSARRAQLEEAAASVAEESSEESSDAE